MTPRPSKSVVTSALGCMIILEICLIKIKQKMKKLSDTTLSGFSFGATLGIIDRLIKRKFDIVSWVSLQSYGPTDLNDIPWMKDTLISIAFGLVVGWIVYMIDKEEKAKGKNPQIPRIEFQHFGTAILFFTILFLGFLFIFVVCEYNEKMLGIEYMFRVSFWEFCCTQVPWLEILVTSIIFGIILAIGFSKSKSQLEHDKEKI